MKAAEGMSKNINGVMQDLAKGYDHGAAHGFLREGKRGKRRDLRSFRRLWEKRFRPAALNIGTFNNYTNEDIRQLTNEIMVTAGQFAKRKGGLRMNYFVYNGFRLWTWGFALRARMCFPPRSMM